MNKNVHSEVAALRGMTPTQLRDKYLQVFGEFPPAIRLLAEYCGGLRPKPFE